MARQRFDALKLVELRQPITIKAPSEKVSDYFGINTFGLAIMKEQLSSDIYRRLQNAINKGEQIDENVADAVATSLKAWAISKGVTHYTHWFQPLTGSTAEKHDAFFELSSEGMAIERFKGSALVRQEPDASSFPSGGLRQTFEARGYTAWDPTSPAFIIESGTGKTLCIPTVFVSYTGESLDNKAPLLKALERVDKTATSVCQIFDRSIEKVQASLGCEQEFFLIDRALADARPDILLTGKTLFGRTPPKGQQLDDHYFGSIPSRVTRFLQELEIEAYKLGIPVKTRHNEVAPSQFEVAPIFEEVNVANDHNQLLMDLMKKVASRHNFRVLFHEKPFEGMNGSGKHNNWSLITDKGKNLLQPSTKAKENLIFITFFINILKAVYDYSDLLRASIASESNDYRLGSNEAPPNIMSAFIGTQLFDILTELENNGDIQVKKGDNIYMKLGINKIPPILLDNTDRNRTSPFAFTGNKFEFRAVGSNANSARAMTVLNTAVANQLELFKKEVDKLIEQDEKKEVAIIDILRSYIPSVKKVVFEGNGYGPEWIKEAKRRGLSNFTDTPRALAILKKPSTGRLFKRMRIMTQAEVDARHEIRLENYTMKMQIESRVMADLALNHIAPTALRYQSILIENVKGMKDIGLGDETEETMITIKKLAKHLNQVKRLANEMTQERKRINSIENVEEKAIAYCDDIKKKYFEELRWHVDKLETMVDDEMWPLPKYRELLFLR
ncbi:glutamine synthetase III family protein [Flammeovirga kamogawensis]|uniref:Glutamine synthetase III n=1 Tax=Flammeovirga kamogawensis TaxID=373891 RepID=A0ABX8GVA5_9BACT|nr:glutamine synthetase III [Flammeovirga kamogawensis]MBB6461539.1 glutamine synthetase [Flammeovirga kamogawensis]QWG07528.1 glutamine synthetase III [Flammeovirga kamogawensis]TRX69342.1 glutamine synthetase type III [Flammeovirga kamogawensis]